MYIGLNVKHAVFFPHFN